jgi:pyruvate kinase
MFFQQKKQSSPGWEILRVDEQNIPDHKKLNFFYFIFYYTIYSMRKTKIVATLGPASESVEVLQKLLQAGVNIARLNFSHGDFSVHQKRLDNLKEASEKTGVAVAVLQDLGGPKIRTGNFETGSVTLTVGQSFTLTTSEIIGDEKKVSVNYPALPKEVRAGEIIFLDDGRVKLQVKEVSEADVICQVLIGGKISGKRGLNLPGSALSAKSLTDKDRDDLEFGIKNKVDFVALSFVREASDISELRVILNERNCQAKIVAKIETPQAVENIDAIIDASDWLMVARGDLAIEIPFEKVPIVQKMITEKCNEVGKPTIIATQMMESMVENSTPTRAEVNDVARAVLDGAEAVMLSEETALGKHPVDVVTDMAKIIEETERDAGLLTI